jgi:hypothetical protein
MAERSTKYNMLASEAKWKASDHIVSRRSYYQSTSKTSYVAPLGNRSPTPTATIVLSHA